MSTNKIIFKNGLLIYSCIVAFFLLMKVLGLDNVSELRFLNFLFVFYGVNRAIKQNIDLNEQESYFNNFYVGFGSSVIGIALTIIGLIVYVGFIDSSFMSVLENSSLWGKELSLEMVVFALSIEGTASSVMCSFILMQYYKNYKPATGVLT
ncbi:hypothetical protein [uncultured Tenacibaculum sp.]|uniref:hypothetical protein n=1 Tax=uncultured Tenacibaculum sp. TaxID=174713 RepID=UPI002612F0DC|nr:hypothetical protein [uncultured Tenacibaculum sp.]